MAFYKHITLILIFMLICFGLLFSTDKKKQIEDAAILIEREQHASAHSLLWKINHDYFANDTTICMMIENAFKGNVYHHGFQEFFMVDKTIYMETQPNERLQDENDTLIVRFSHPENWIKRALEINPENGKAYFLLGYYSKKAKLPELSVESAISSDIKKIQKEIAINFEKAFKYGYRHKELCSFLGDYYLKEGIIHRAKKFYRWNAMERYFDSESVIQLASIYLNEKKTEKSLELAFSALSHLNAPEINLKYMALRIIANSNKEQGSLYKFKYYNTLCQQLIPEQSDAYLDMIHFYDQENKEDSIIYWINQLFSQNPFDVKNYDMIDYISRQRENNEKLLELLRSNREEYSQYDAVLAYSWWKEGDIYFRSGRKSLAKEAWSKSRLYFLKFMDSNNIVFKKIGKVKK